MASSTIASINHKECNAKSLNIYVPTYQFFSKWIRLYWLPAKILEASTTFTKQSLSTHKCCCVIEIQKVGHKKIAIYTKLYARRSRFKSILLVKCSYNYFWLFLVEFLNKMNHTQVNIEVLFQCCSFAGKFNTLMEAIISLNFCDWINCMWLFYNIDSNYHYFWLLLV